MDNCSTNLVIYEQESVLNDSLFDKYSLLIPKGYIVAKEYGGAKFESYIYIYKDKSIIYFGKSSSRNGEEIENLTDSIRAKRLSVFSIELIAKIAKSIGKEYQPETIVLSGKKRGKYWKDIRIDFINIGYSNVRKENLPVFEKALQSLEKIK